MNRFKLARMNSGLQQKVVASELGVSVQSMSYWESGNRTPSKENLLKMAEMYGVSTDYLLGKDPEDVAIVAEIKKEPVLADEFSDLTESERQLLKSFRRCTPVSRARVLAYAEGASDHL